MSVIILLRHGQSQWNKENLFTGLANPPLTAEGRQEAYWAALSIAQQAGVKVSYLFTSMLQRAQETAQIVSQNLKLKEDSIIQTDQLNERDYGSLTGMNKQTAQEEFGAQQVHSWRRSYEASPPEGESLKHTVERVVTYWTQSIEPLVRQGHHVMVVAHGNSLRALMMHLEKIPPQDIEHISIETCQPIIYELDAQLKVVSKRVLEKEHSQSKVKH